VREQLGCPTETEQGSDIAEQPFEKGSMFWYGPPLNPIFVLAGIDRGTWLRFEDEALRALPTPTPDPAPPCAAPLVSGFGLVWGSFANVRTALGCPTAGEDGPFDGAYQPFARGTMLFSPVGLGRGKTIYVLYDNGTFERYDDTNP
jgi:serine/threonine-protein kinase